MHQSSIHSALRGLYEGNRDETFLYLEYFVRKGFLERDGDLFNSHFEGNVSEKLIVRWFLVESKLPFFFYPWESFHFVNRATV